MSAFAEEKQFALNLIDELLHELAPNAKKPFQSFVNALNNNLPTQEIVSEIKKSCQMLDIIRAFSLYNILLNIIEERCTIQDENPLAKISRTLGMLKEQIHPEQIQQILHQMRFYPVFTAHPTESLRRTFLEAHFRISEDLHKIFDLQEAEHIKTEHIENIKYRLHLLWQTHLVRAQKLEVLFELDNLLFIITHSILPSAQATIKAINQFLDKPLEASPIVLGSWIGGDRDGNPFVSNDLMIKVMKEQHHTIISLYLNKIQNLIRELSIAKEYSAISAPLLASIEKEKEYLSETSRTLYQNEPFRAKLSLMRQKLKNRLIGINSNWQDPFVYRHCSELLEDIRLLESSLTPRSKERLIEFKNLVLLADFYLLRLDFREHKNVFIQAISEIFATLNLAQNFSSLTEPKKQEILALALDSAKINLLELSQDLSKSTQDCIGIFYAILWGKENLGENILRSFILSMTTDASDLLIILYFAKQSGLWQPNLSAQIAITPLFETIEDLQNSYQIMQTLSQDKHYSLYLKDCQNHQEIMVGYSDSGKDGGIFSSNFNLYKAISKLMELGEELNIEFKLFHGKGGSVSRGGGSLDSALEAAAPKSVQGRLKVTEQGEIISSKYLRESSARYNFANTISALVKRSAWDLKNANLCEASTPKIQKDLAAISAISQKVYRDLVYENPDFITYFKFATPISFIQELNLGSRPSKRKDTQRIEDLRAIPWVFAWTQNRSIIPAWYGIGSALKTMDHQDFLRKMYVESKFFQTTIDNISQAFLKVDLEVAKLYNVFVPQSKGTQEIWEKITQEYHLTLELLLKMRQEKTLLDSEPIARESILMRKASVTALNLLQITLIQDYHNQTSLQRKAELMEEIHSTIVGIAQGLRNTG